MSDQSVKRWRMSDMPLSEYGLYTEVVLASEYDNLSAKLSTTNSNWPHEKDLHEIIATQTRVIEKLKDSLFWFEVNSYDKRDAEKAGQFWRELVAIERGKT